MEWKTSLLCILPYSKGLVKLLYGGVIESEKKFDNNRPNISANTFLP